MGLLTRTASCQRTLWVMTGPLTARTELVGAKEWSREATRTGKKDLRSMTGGTCWLGLVSTAWIRQHELKRGGLQMELSP